MEHIYLQVKIPDSLFQVFKNEVYQFLITLPNEEISSIKDNLGFTYVFSISDINLDTYIEDKLDKYINYNLRYILEIHTNESIYPSSVRINKKGKKILTKRQTKNMML